MAKKKNVISSDEIDFGTIRAPKAKDNSRKVSKAGVLTIISAEQSTRLIFSKKILKKFGYPNEVQIGMGKKKLFIGIKDLFQADYYSIRYGNKEGRKGNVYNKKLIDEIIEEYDLDFGEHISLTFPKVKFIETEDGEIQGAYISMKQAQEK